LARQAFPQRNPGGDGIGSFIRADVALADPFVPAWAVGVLYQSHRSCQDVYDMLTEAQNQLVEAIRSWSKLFDDHKTLQQEHLGCAGKEATLAKKLVVSEKEKDELLDKSRAQKHRIKNLEEALTSKTSSLPEVENLAATLKGDLERLTMDLSHAEIVRHNYIRQLIPIVFQQLNSSYEYKKSLSNVFNQAIVVG
ncbi:hypothetical protein Tco_1348079, partial [Tanacetum coccineum]